MERKVVAMESNVACAYAWRDCPDCGGFGEERTLGHNNIELVDDCPTCDGAGRAMALGGVVRERCLNCLPDEIQANVVVQDDILRYPPPTSKCAVCHGRGTVPTTDPLKWLDAIHELGYEIRTRKGRGGMCSIIIYQAEERGFPNYAPWGDGGREDNWGDALIGTVEVILEHEGYTLGGA